MRDRSPEIPRVRLLLALVAYVPLLWNAPGKVSADTKTYLYLDPGGLLRKAASLWDPAVGLGTVTHQTIGYLWPMGPWYGLCSALGLPDWLAQRLWLGTVFFAAGSGVVALARHFGLRWRAVLVAALAYQLSPYVLSYVARLSVILLPWAGLGWMLLFTIRGAQTRRWRYAAGFALLVATVGSVNATAALVLAGLAPLCWLGWATWGSREITPGQALGCAVRFGVLTLPISAFWIAGLWAQGRYGIPILRYTETYEAVARVLTPTEVLRGLGYWFGYGRDKVSPWVDPVGAYTHNPVLIVVSLAVPALALVSLARVRWRERTFCALLLVVGLVVAVGAHPFDHPSISGAGVRAVVESTVGRALRSTPRAGPLVALALALALGVGCDTLVARRPRWRVAAPAIAVVLVAVNLPSLWAGSMYTSSLLREEIVPAGWRQLGDALDQGDPETRVLDMPGSDFADYRWGGTVDPVLPGLTGRDVVYRELVPSGSAASADLVAALDRRWQDRLTEQAAIAPLLRLMGVSDVVLRGDLQYERYRLARPKTLAALLAATPGITAVKPFGPLGVVPGNPRFPLVDEEELLTPRSARQPAPVTLYQVADPQPVVRAESTTPVIVAGDGEGLVDIAAIGRLDEHGPVLYAGDLATRPDALDAALDAGADVIVTDTNRRQARRWGSVRENLGATETADEEPLRTDVTDNRLDLFPGASSDSYTTAELVGMTRVRATGYGNPITYTPEDRAAMAVDGDPTTAWRVGAFAEVRGERLELELSVPTSTDHLTLLQPTDGPRNRFITGVRLRFDGGDPLDVALDDSSRSAPGQRIDIGDRTFTTLSIEITDTNFTRLPGYRGISAVGFAEVQVGEAHAVEYIRLPDDVLGRTGDDRRLTLVMTRQRATPLEVNRHDPEPVMRRVFTLPTTRTVDLSGTGQLSPRASDAVLNSVLLDGSVTAVSSARLAGDPASTALAVIDNDPSTAWQSPIDAPLQQLTIHSERPTTLNQLRLALLADGRHSVPTQMRVSVDGGAPVTLALPLVKDQPTPGAVVRIAANLPTPLQGSTFVVDITAVREVRSTDYTTELPVVLPVGIVELGVGDIVGVPVAQDTSRCRNDLITLDGEPVSVRLVREKTTVRIESCTGALPWAAGEHRIEVSDGRVTGIDIDRLVVDSAGTVAPAADEAAPATSAGTGSTAAEPSTAGDASTAPTLRVTRDGRTNYRVDAVTTRGSSFWLVLGQSYNAGWHASIDGTDLGRPTLVDGYANGWLITPDSGSAVVQLSWTPQSTVAWSLAISGIAALLCVLILVGALRSRARARRPRHRAEREEPMGARPASLLPPAAVIGAGLCSGWQAALVVLLVLVAAAVVPGRLPERWRARATVGAVAPAAFLAVVVAYVVAKQTRYDLPTDLDWPRAFDAVQPLAWAAVFVAVPLWPGAPVDAPLGTIAGGDGDGDGDGRDHGGDAPVGEDPPVVVSTTTAPVVLGTGRAAPSPPGRVPSWPPGRRRAPAEDSAAPATPPPPPPSRRPSWPPGPKEVADPVEAPEPAPDET